MSSSSSASSSSPTCIHCNKTFETYCVCGNHHQVCWKHALICEENENDIKLKPVENEPGFVWSNIGPTKIIIRENDKFVNITKLCTRNKKFTYWNNTKKAKELIPLVKKIIKKPPIDLSRAKSGSMVLRGTYVHVDIAYAVAMWVNSKYFHYIIRTMRRLDNEKRRQIILQSSKKSTTNNTNNDDSKINKTLEETNALLEQMSKTLSMAEADNEI